MANYALLRKSIACTLVSLFINFSSLLSIEFVECDEPSPIKVVVIGGGPTSLGFLHRFYEQGGLQDNVKIMAFEEQNGPGGLARSERDSNGFLFDYGGHVVFSHYTYFDHILDTFVPEWNFLVRESYAFMSGSDGIRRFIPYPVQNNIHAMSKEDRNECLKGLEFLINSRDSSQENKTPSFKDWLLGTFGEPLYTKFMQPYNKKVWTVDPSEMNVSWVGERVAPLDFANIQSKVKSANENESRQIFASPLYPSKDDGWGPNNTFRYPAKGGNGSIWQAIANKIPRAWIHYGKRVVSINTERKILKVIDVESNENYDVPYDILVSTTPLDLLIANLIELNENTEEKESTALESIKILKALKDKFIHTSSHIIGLGIKGNPPDFLKDKSWMYFPDSDSPFYRITVFSNYSKDHVPNEQYWSLMCECAESTESKGDAWNKENIINSTIAALVDYGFINDTAIVSTFYKKLEYGYPVPFLARDEVLDIVQPILESQSIYSRGRFGGWKYEVSNQDHCFMQGVELSDFLFKGIPEMTFIDPNKANAPGKRNEYHHSLSREADKSLGMNIEYVIAHYKEDLRWLDPVKDKTHIYHKGGGKIPQNNYQLWEALPNVGREGHTYLQHIVDNYDRLADVTFFLQGNIGDHLHSKNTPKLMFFETLDKGFSFSSNTNTLSQWFFARSWCSKGHLQHMTYSNQTFGQYWEYIFERAHPEQILVNYGGCFAATKETLRKYPKDFYIRILNTLTNGSNPEEGYYVERMWRTILQN